MPIAMERRRHLLIAGTGRSGTSLLVKLLTACGLDTELSHNPHSHWDDTANAGLETIPLLKGNHPYVIKSTLGHEFVDHLLRSEDVQLDGVIIPIRNLAEATASRIILELRDVHESNAALGELTHTARNRAFVPGGAIYSVEPIDQARILASSLHLSLERLLDQDIPLYLLKFPRFVHHIDYLYKTLSPILADRVGREDFSNVVRSIVDPDKVRVTEELENGAGHATVATSPLGGAASSGLPTLGELDNLALKRELRRVRERSNEAVAQRDALTRERDALTKELHVMTRKFDGVMSERDALRQQHAALRGQHDRLVESLSWKVTAPLRGLRSLFNRPTPRMVE